jgi:uncharacterized protein YbaR (Trm112 family)
MPMTLSKDLLDKLACPKCRSPLEVVEDGRALACGTCDVAYAVVAGIPDLVIGEGSPLGAK